jgi:hypothetical protein
MPAEMAAQPSDAADLTARLISLREAVENQVKASQELLDSRIKGAGTQREILLDGITVRFDLLQEEIDRRFHDLRDLLDERRDSSQHANTLLQEEMDRRLGTLDKLSVQRYDDLKELMQAGQTSADKAVQAALAAAKEAVTVAQTASEKRLDGVNEFRKTLSDQTATFVPRPEHATELKALAERVTADAARVTAMELRLTSRLDLDQGQATGSDKQIADKRLDTTVVLQIFALLVVAAGVIISIVLR